MDAKIENTDRSIKKMKTQKKENIEMTTMAERVCIGLDEFCRKGQTTICDVTENIANDLSALGQNHKYIIVNSVPNADRQTSTSAKFDVTLSLNRNHYVADEHSYCRRNGLPFRIFKKRPHKELKEIRDKAIKEFEKNGKAVINYLTRREMICVRDSIELNRKDICVMVDWEKNNNYTYVDQERLGWGLYSLTLLPRPKRAKRKNKTNLDQQTIKRLKRAAADLIEELECHGHATISRLSAEEAAFLEEEVKRRTYITTTRLQDLDFERKPIEGKFLVRLLINWNDQRAAELKYCLRKGFEFRFRPMRPKKEIERLIHDALKELDEKNRGPNPEYGRLIEINHLSFEEREYVWNRIRELRGHTVKVYIDVAFDECHMPVDGDMFVHGRYALTLE